MPMRYQTGEAVEKGDRVLFHDEPGEIEFIVDGPSGDPDKDWHIEQGGGGVMVLEPKFFGHAFIRDTEHAEDLVFVSRGETS